MFKYFIWIFCIENIEFRPGSERSERSRRVGAQAHVYGYIIYDNVKLGSFQPEKNASNRDILAVKDVVLKLQKDTANNDVFKLVVLILPIIL